MDEPGQKASKECALLLSPGKAKIARLPMKDANECLVAGKGKELIDALWGAVPYRPDGIRSGAELWEDIKKPPPAGYEIPYPGLNDKLGGVRLGELVLFTAGSGIGKSTIVNEIAYHLMMAHGLTLGVMALEENPARNARRYLGIHLNKPLHLPAAHASVPETDLKAAFDAVMAPESECIPPEHAIRQNGIMTEPSPLVPSSKKRSNGNAHKPLKTVCWTHWNGAQHQP